MKKFYHGKMVKIKPKEFFEEYFSDKPYFSGNFGNNWIRHSGQYTKIIGGIDENWRLDIDKGLVFWYDCMIEPVD